MYKLSGAIFSTGFYSIFAVGLRTDGAGPLIWFFGDSLTLKYERENSRRVIASKKTRSSWWLTDFVAARNEQIKSNIVQSDTSEIRVNIFYFNTRQYTWLNDFIIISVNCEIPKMLREKDWYRKLMDGCIIISLNLGYLKN